jgi:hypothetical protein
MPLRFTRGAADFRRDFAILREMPGRLRDLPATDLRRGFFFLTLPTAALRAFAVGLGFLRPLCGALGFSKAFLAVSLAAETGVRPVAAAFPASAPTSPPMTAPAGPATLPSAAPATAPAVSFGMGGI